MDGIHIYLFLDDENPSNTGDLNAVNVFDARYQDALPSISNGQCLRKDSANFGLHGVIYNKIVLPYD
jgi:hypothetical protein